MEPLITVVIPCYNYGEYIEEAIDSVLSSTYSNVEVFVVNDGSTDPYTLEVLEKMALKPKTRVFNRGNGGLSAARNTGISFSNADYILLLDADDLIDPTFIEKGIWLLQEHPEVAFVYPLVKLFGKVNYIWRTQIYNFFYLKFRNFIPATIIVRRDAWEKVGGYDESMCDGYEDWEFLIRLGNLGFYGLHMNEVLFFYRKHSGSMLEGSKKKHGKLFRQIRERHPSLYKSWLLQFLLFLLIELNRRTKGYISKLRKLTLNIIPNDIKEILKKLYYRFTTLRKKDSYQGYRPKVYEIKGKDKDKLAPKSKVTVMIILPWLHVGGVEKVFMKIMKELHLKYNFILVTTVPKTTHPWENQFSPFVKALYHIGDFGSSDQERSKFLLDIIKRRSIKIIHISNSQFGYKFLVDLRNQSIDVRVMDTLHMEEPWAAWDYFSFSQPFSSLLDLRVTLTSSQSERVRTDYSNVCIIPNGVEILPSISLPLNKDPFQFKIAFIARFAKQKQPLLFVHVAKICSDRQLPVKFVMYGDGDLKKEVIELIKKMNLGHNIEIHDFTDNIYNTLSQVNLLCLPSLREGFPMIGLEAMNAGIPIVATRVPGWSDLVIDGQTGFLCEANPIDLADKCEKLYGDKDLYKQIRENARKYVQENFSVGTMAAHYNSLYSTLAFEGKDND